MSDVERGLDPMLVGLVQKIQASVGADVCEAFIASRGSRVSAWSGRDVIDFIVHVRRTTGDDLMGMGAAPCSAGANEFLIDIGCRASTLREALTLGFHFMSMVTTAVQFRLREEGDLALIEVREEYSDLDPGRVLSDWSLIVCHKLSQWLIGSEICLERTEFAHELDAAYSSYSGMFGGVCYFNSDCGRLVFKRCYLDERAIRTPAEGEWLKTRAPGAFAQTGGMLAKPWKNQARDLLRSDLELGRRISSLEELAEHFGFSSQTLRRRLRKEGTSYRELKAQVRTEKALDVLADRKTSVGSASIAAGFAESNALSRALKATQGISSSELREQIRNDGRRVSMADAAHRFQRAESGAMISRAGGR